MCSNENTAQRWVTITSTMIAIAGLVGSVREASAQDSPRAREAQKELQGDFARPLNKAQQAEGRRARSGATIVMNENDGGTSYSVRISNGETTVERDGEELSKDRYRINDETVEFLDEDGKVEHTMKLPSVDGMAGDGARAFFNWGEPGARGLAPLAMGQQVEPPPPVMLGVSMSDHEDGARLDVVHEGLPADKAGLKAGDIIVRIGDARVTDQADARKALRTHKAGDKVDIVVLRDGDRKVIGAELAAWDAEKLGIEARALAMAPDARWLRFNDEDFAQNFGEHWWSNGSRDTIRSARKALEEALEAVKAAGNDLEDLRKAANDGLQSAIDSLKEAEEKTHEGGLRVFSPDAEGQGGVRRMVIPRVEVQRRAEAEREAARGHADEMREQMEQLRKEMEQLRKEMQENAKKGGR